MSNYEEDILQASIDDINDKIDVYNRIIEEEFYKEEELPTEVEGQIKEYTEDYESPGEALTEFAKYIAYERNELRQLMEDINRENIPRRMHIHYQNIEDKMWSIPPQLYELESVPFLEPSLAQIISKQLTMEDILNEKRD